MAEIIIGCGKKHEAEMFSMTAIMIARICRLYQKAKKGDIQAYYCLENIGIKGNKVEVLRKVEDMVKDHARKVG